MNQKFIILLCGRSGSGKTTVAEKLEELYGWTSVQSYTDRAMRSPDEKGHIFVTETRFDLIPPEEMVAYTEFDGHRYCATRGQVDDNEIYVIDPVGVRTFFQKYNGSKTVLTVVLNASSSLAKRRMKKRGDSKKKIRNRIANDEVSFDGVELLGDLVVDVKKKSPEKIAKEISSYVESIVG